MRQPLHNPKRAGVATMGAVGTSIRTRTSSMAGSNSMGTTLTMVEVDISSNTPTKMIIWEGVPRRAGREVASAEEVVAIQT